VITVRELLWPRLRGMTNQFTRSGRAEKITASLFLVFGLLFWLGISAMFAWFIHEFYAIEIVGPIVLRKLMDLLLMSLFALLCFSNIVTALSTFYLSDDLELLLSLPISRVTLFVSRLIETMAQSSWMALAFGLPVLTAYGLTYGAGPLYYALVLLVLPTFLLIPATLGVSVATLLVTIFPARRIREALAGVGVLCLVAIFITLRMLRPERLADTESFESVAAYVAELQTPVPLLTPPRWAADVLMAALLDRPLPLVDLAMLVTGAIGLFGVSRWLTAWLHDTGRSRAQEARGARLAKAGWLDAILALWTRPLSPEARAIVTKDVKTFFRDPAQWTQVFLVASIVAIAIVSVASLPLDVFRGPWMAAWVNALAFLMLALVGLVMAALAARFQFSAVSAEGRGFWVVRTSPLTARQFLWAKAWPGLPPMILVGETLALSSTRLLGASPFLTGVAMVTALLMALGISGIAIGMGAIWPNFKADNAARVASGPAGLLFMAVSVSLVMLVLALEAAPVYFVLSAVYQEVPMTPTRTAITAGCLLATTIVCLIAAIWPIHYGARRLWDRELPNG
jgi:ABC-2 type transport system permease protein